MAFKWPFLDLKVFSSLCLSRVNFDWYLCVHYFVLPFIWYATVAVDTKIIKCTLSGFSPGFVFHYLVMDSYNAFVTCVFPIPASTSMKICMDSSLVCILYTTWLHSSFCFTFRNCKKFIVIIICHCRAKEVNSCIIVCIVIPKWHPVSL